MNKSTAGVTAILRRVLPLVFAAFLVLPAASCSGSSNAESGPDSKLILARLDELVPLSQELNEIFVGEGIKPIDKAVKSEYDAGSEYFEVADDAPYRDIASLKAAAEKVYSTDYLESVYLMAFEGSEKDEITPRYKEVAGVLYVDIAWKPLELRTVIDLSSAAIVESAADKVQVKVNYTLEGDTGSGGQMTLVLINQNGTWLLDGPTF